MEGRTGRYGVWVKTWSAYRSLASGPGMGIGDVRPVSGVPDCHVVDTGMFGTAEYGAVYLLDGERPALVDSGIGADLDRIVAAVDRVGIEPAVVLLTHVHLDHAGGAGDLAERYDADVVVHERGAAHLEDPTRLVEGTKAAVGDMWRHYASPTPVDPDRIVAVAGGASVTAGGRRVEIREAPGHAPHQVVYHDPDSGAVFAGDAAGIYVPSLDRVIETTPPPQFDVQQCLDDLDSIAALDPRTVCYGHAGPAGVEEGPRGNRLEAYRGRLQDWVTEAKTALRETDEDPETAAGKLDYPFDTERVWGPEKAHAELVLNLRGVASQQNR